VTTPIACSSLVPAEWEKGVEGAALPPLAEPASGDKAKELVQTLDALKNWTEFGLFQTVKLDQANGRTRDAIGIVRRCEERDRAAVRKARPKLLGIF
jgi:hypothetical protein